MDPSATSRERRGVPSRDEQSALFRAFGAAVRQRREELGLSQEEFGFESGLDRTYVSGIERGVRNPTIRVVIRLAAALQTRPSALWKRAEDEKGLRVR